MTVFILLAGEERINHSITINYINSKQNLVKNYFAIDKLKRLTVITSSTKLKRLTENTKSDFLGEESNHIS